MSTHFFAVLALAASFGCQEAPQASAPEAAQSVTANAPAAPARPREPVSADGAYERGRQLMEKHCGDCYKRSTAGVLEAVEMLQQAVALGRNDADVHRLLRDAYNGLAYIDYRHDDARRRPYEELLHQEIRTLAKLDPADLENRMRYVELLDSNAAKVAELNEVTSRFPKHAFARYRLAQLLIEEGHVKEAAAQARNWLELADPNELEEYSGRMFVSADEEGVRQLLELDPKLHPASFELAKRAVRERRGAKQALDIARASLDDAPPIVANSYLSALTTLLASVDNANEAAALQKEYASKAKAGEAQRRQFY
jgi:hypothetical protein